MALTNHCRLNLTTANHCILIEPQWNPMVEEQAISRIHRLGQTKAVFICRFVIINTFEQRILERQTRKRVLADLVLGRQKLKEGDDGRKQLAVWLSLVPKAQVVQLTETSTLAFAPVDLLTRTPKLPPSFAIGCHLLVFFYAS
jgi:hypothetical protein